MKWFVTMPPLDLHLTVAASGNLTSFCKLKIRSSFYSCTDSSLPICILRSCIFSVELMQDRMCAQVRFDFRQEIASSAVSEKARALFQNFPDLIGTVDGTRAIASISPDYITTKDADRHGVEFNHRESPGPWNQQSPRKN
jgi:hypothetical protein